MKTTTPSATLRENPRSDHNNIRIGIFLILIGSIFAAETYFRVHILYRFWPLVLTAWGCGFIGIYHRRERREAAFLGLGLYVIFFSLFSLYFTFSGWESLARLWPAYIGFLGATFLLLFLFHRNRRIYLLIGMFLGCVCVAFFLVFYLSGDLWWTTFILVGLSVLAFGRSR
ncbi:MAG: hypothetical protein KA419_06595 [Acidobacteria bacterium]|nr:hypothetical protein [Acidobacteriota bacterium]